MPPSRAAPAALVLLATLVPPAVPAEPSHALALHGAPAYGPDFRHFGYVDPGAPRGGQVRLSALGTFDNLNPFILKGVSAAGLGRVHDTLAVPSLDEAFSYYGLIAETMEAAPDGTWVEYTLREGARFHDGSPITVDDVVFSLDTLKQRGHPFYRAYYASVLRAEARGPRTVRFVFADGENRELPLITGQLPVLSRAWWSGRDFASTTLEPPLGSGPYRVEAVDPGRSVTYRRVDDYWAADLPVRSGQHNFDRIRYDYYRDGTVALEAFKAGEYDFRQENNSKLWATGYRGPAFDRGLARTELIRHHIPTGMQGFVFNTRRPVFSDPRVREALAHAFDFEWTNKNLFYGQYTRTRSYFSNSELAARGLPTPAERTLLEPFADRLDPRVLTTEYRPPGTDGSGNIRANLRVALRLLKAAGWTVRDRRLVRADTGEPMEFELLLVQPAFERVALPFQRNLERLGARVRVRTVDAAQYEKRVEDFDFDMIISVFGQSASPGNEQRDYWTSEKADVPGSGNLAGVRDPVVDALVEALVRAPDRAGLVARSRALDRVLQWGHYVIPNWHIPAFRVAYWDRFSRPAVSPDYALGFDTWWVDPEKDRRVAAGRSAGR